MGDNLETLYGAINDGALDVKLAMNLIERVLPEQPSPWGVSR